MSNLQIVERVPLRGRIAVWEGPVGAEHDEMLWLRKKGLLVPVRRQDNMITDGFITAFLNRMGGTATDRDTMIVGYQAVGSGTGTPQINSNQLSQESFRRAKDQTAITGQMIIIATTFGSLVANVPQGRITSNYDPTSNGGTSNGAPSLTSWTIEPYIPPSMSPYDAAYVSQYFKRFRIGDRVRFGVGAGNVTYEYAVLTNVVYNAAGTECTITIAGPGLSAFPPYLATVDGTWNEVGVIADFPTPTTVTANAGNLTSFQVNDRRYFFAGDYVRLTRLNYLTVSGASFDLNQYGVVDTITPGVGNAGTITLVAPGWQVDFPAPGTAPAPLPQNPQTGDTVVGGRLYNFVTGLGYVKTRQKSTLVETIFNTQT